MMLFLLLRLVKRTFAPLIILLLVVGEYASGVRPPPSVEVNKCCRNGETLGRNRECTGGGSEQWWPVIYLIGKQSLFAKKGEAPRFIHAHENTQPSCSNPELYLNNIALFSNGSLFLGERNSFVDLKDYCIDQDIALVCSPNQEGSDSLRAPKKLTKIRKCCSLDTILAHDKTCVPQSATQPQLFQANNLSQIDLVYGFPVCATGVTNKFVIADQFHERNLNIDDGTYALQNAHRVLKNGEFCIDHTNQNANLVTATVFACDDLVTVKEAPGRKNEEVCGEIGRNSKCPLPDTLNHWLFFYRVAVFSFTRLL